MDKVTVEQTKSNVTVYDIELDALEIHEYANLTPQMNNLEFKALKDDIAVNGQRDPGTLYRGKIVDGRHRFKALAELGAKSMKFIKLPSTTTLEEIAEIVRSKETRRHDTIAQKAIMAYNKLKTSKDNLTQADVAEMYGVHRKRVGEVKKIEEFFGRKDILNWLFEGNKFNIGTENRPKLSDSLPAIVNWLEVNAVMHKIPDFMEELVEAREALTSEEELLVAKLANQIGREREAVRKALASKLYATVGNLI